MIAFRLCSQRYPPKSGEGAALNGGRWNPPGVPVVYTAATASLGILEVLAHHGVIPAHYVLVKLDIADSVDVEQVEMLSPRLPDDWRALEPPPSTQAIGRQWFSAGRTAILSVPSVIVPQERNYVINVLHPQFSLIRFGRSEPFRLDPRVPTRSVAP